MLNWLARLALTLAALAACGCASAPPPASGSMGRSFDDATAGMAIRARMMRSLTDFSRVDVNVAGGLVLLVGRVNDDDARDEAERIALSAPKVRGVANEIEVQVGGRRAFGVHDQLIASQVRARFISDQFVRNAAINVETYDGVVYLLGRVRTEDEARRAASSASFVGGVRRVVSFLIVDPDEPAPTAPEIERREPGQDMAALVTP